MTAILVRYSEIGLKGRPVRKRFVTQLKENMMDMLARDRTEALVVSDDSRLFVTAADTDGAVRSLKKVFGISSVSVTETCGSDIAEICGTAAEYSRTRIRKGQTFAVRARREGVHPYTSMELGKEAGSAIFLANEGLKVDLNDPDVTFFIEVRNNKAYIFSSYVRAHAGLPLGSQGKVLAFVNDDRGLLSAWLMMKRGCRAVICGDHGIDILKAFDPSLRTIGEADAEKYLKKDVSGVVLGTSVGGLNDVDVSKYSVPVFFPTIGMNDDEVSGMLDIINSDVA